MAENINVLNAAWGATYPVDGIHFERSRISVVDGVGLFLEANGISVNGKIGHFTLKEWDQIDQYRMHPISQATSFLGMPNRMHNLNQEQSWKNIFYNFIGWEEDVSPLKKAVNLLLMPFRIPLNLISMPFKWVVNIAKLVTEFLPLMARDTLRFAAEAAKEDKDSKLATALNFFSEGFNVMYVLLRPITSPIQNVRDLWNQNKHLWGSGNEDLAATFMVLSVFQTGIAYTFLFPFVVYGLVVSALPAIVTQLPAIMGHMPTWLSTIMSPVLAGMAKVGLFVAKYSGVIGAGLGYGIPTVGNLLDHLSSKVAGWFREWGKVNQPQGEEPGIIGKRDDEPKPENEFKPGPNDEPKPAPQVELKSDLAAKDEPKAEQPDVPGSVSVINEKLQQEEEKRAEEDRAAKEKLEQEEKEKQRLIEEQQRAEEERATKEAKEKLEQEEKARKQATDEIQRERDHVAESLAKLVECGANFVKPNQPELASHPSAMFSPANHPVKVAQSGATSVSEDEARKLEEEALQALSTITLQDLKDRINFYH